MLLKVAGATSTGQHGCKNGKTSKMARVFHVFPNKTITFGDVPEEPPVSAYHFTTTFEFVVASGQLDHVEFHPCGVSNSPWLPSVTHVRSGL